MRKDRAMYEITYTVGGRSYRELHSGFAVVSKRTYELNVGSVVDKGSVCVVFLQCGNNTTQPHM